MARIAFYLPQHCWMDYGFFHGKWAQLSLNELTEAATGSFSASGFSKFPFGRRYKIIKAAHSADANTCPGAFESLISDVINMQDIKWNCVQWPQWSLISASLVEWQMFHRSVRWKQEVIYSSSMHLHICFRLKNVATHWFDEKRIPLTLMYWYIPKQSTNILKTPVGTNWY